MYKLRKAAVVAITVASVGLVGAGTAQAGGGKGGGSHSRTQSNRVDSPKQQPTRVSTPQQQPIRVNTPQQQLSPEIVQPQQWGDSHHHGKSHGRKIDIRQSTSCRSHEANVDVLGNVGILNGLLANAFNGEGDSGVQSTKIGSTKGCNNIIRR
ncbi:hypothetical protein ACWD6P_06555 [Streptomyces sp. NPDC002446]